VIGQLALSPDFAQKCGLQVAGTIFMSRGKTWLDSIEQRPTNSYRHLKKTIERLKYF